MKRKEQWSLRHGSHHWQLVGSSEIEKRDGGRTIKSKKKRKEENDKKKWKGIVAFNQRCCISLPGAWIGFVGANGGVVMLMPVAGF